MIFQNYPNISHLPLVIFTEYRKFKSRNNEIGDKFNYKGLQIRSANSITKAMNCSFQIAMYNVLFKTQNQSFSVSILILKGPNFGQ